MSQYKSNLIANFAGSGVAALLQLVSIPFYIKFLGIESYGLVGFYIMLQAVLQVLDLGLGPTMNREMARYSVRPEKAEEARDFARTLETGYWILGVAAGAAIALFAPLIATRWIHVGTVPLPVARQAFMLMGALAVLQLPLAFYQGGLMGLQKQVPLNGIRIAAAVSGTGGAVFILWAVSPTIVAFLLWQLAVGAVQLLALAVCLWRNLPPGVKAPRFDPELLRTVFRFAAGMSGITVTTIVLTQLDKILLSRLLSLEMFGYYTLATAVGNGLYVLITPVFHATFPRLSAMVADRDESGVREQYHLGTQVMAVLVIPVAAVVALFSQDVISLWTGNGETARNAATAASLLIAGTAMNGLMNLPYALQLAYGWTRIALTINTFAIVAMVPAIVFLTSRYGAAGGAAAWVLLNGALIVVGIPMTHRRLLTEDAWRWVLRDVAPPLAVTLLVVSVGRLLATSPMTSAVAVMTLGALWMFCAGLSAMAAPMVRTWLISQGRLLLAGR